MKKFFLFGLLSLLFNTAYAIKEPPIYSEEVSVANQNEEQRDEAIQQAFTRLLIKISGDNSILENPAIKTAIVNAKNKVQEFEYIPTHDASQPFLLNIQFNAKAVNQLVQNAKLPAGTTHQLLTFKMIVNGINGQEDFENLMQLLKRTASIKQLEVDHVSSDQVVLTLAVQGERKVFMQDALLGQHLQLQQEQEDLLTYGWVH
jgi:hypothetical protein